MDWPASKSIEGISNFHKFLWKLRWLVCRKLVASAAGVSNENKEWACIASIVNHCKLTESIKLGKSI